MGIERLIPTETQIFEAERKRTQGRVREAAREMWPGTMQTFYEPFTALSMNEKQRMLMASRIHVVSKISEAKRSWSARETAAHLSLARTTIKRVYRDPMVRKELPQIKKDTKGNPYEFSTEFARDEISYSVVLAALTGNTELLDNAVSRMDEVIGKSEETTARTLAVFEKERLRHQQGDSSMDFVIFQGSFKRAVEASEALNRWERVATIGSWYMVDMATAGHPSEAFRGLKTAVRAGLKDHSTATIPIRQTAQALTNGIRHFMWKATTLGDEDYSSLQLPD